MNEYNCTECGRSISEHDLEQGIALELDGDFYCADCSGDRDPDDAADQGHEKNLEQVVDLDEQDSSSEEKETPKKSEVSSSRRRAAHGRRGKNGSPRRSRSAASSRRGRAASSGSSRRIRASEEDEEAVSDRRRVFLDRSVEDKMKIIVLTISALFIVMGFMFLLTRGCRGSQGGGPIIRKTKAKELIDQARRLKQEGIRLYHKGNFNRALNKYYAAQAKYEEVLNHVRKEKLTPEEKAQGLSYDWIDGEYCSLGPLIQSAREMKVRRDNRRERLNR